MVMEGGKEGGRQGRQEGGAGNWTEGVRRFNDTPFIQMGE